MRKAAGFSYFQKADSSASPVAHTPIFPSARRAMSFFPFRRSLSICLSLHASLSVCLCICLCRGTLGAIKPNDREPMGNAVEPLNVPTSRDENVAASRQAQMTGVLFFRMQPRGGRVASASDCGVRGPRFELHRGRLCLSRQPQRCAALVTGCAPLLQCLGRLSLPPVLRGTLK